ncbi:MAG: response regulator [Thermodesulfobacteriota bacterium]
MAVNQKILIVDDRKENLVALRQVLSGLDVEIIEAASGNEALAATLDHSFALAILDVRMPGMDGYELAKYLRSDAKTRNIPLIFLTAGHAEEEHIFKGYEAGGVDYIVKPYTPGVLVSKVRVFLELAEIHEELTKHRDQLNELIQERVKEQACLYKISEALAEPIKLDEALRRAVNHIPSGLRYPDITCARLLLDDGKITSQPFRESRWRLDADVVVQGQTRGALEVFYTEERPNADLGPFLKEEQALIAGIARVLGQAIARSEALGREKHLNAVLRGIRNVNQLIVREPSRERLVQVACSGLVRDRAFNGVWIVLTDRLPERVDASHYGFTDKKFSKLVTLFKKGKMPQCCSRSQAEGSIIATINPTLECEECPLANDYEEEGAGLSVKLEYQGTHFGCMGISLHQRSAADQEEQLFLEEVSSDIAFALHNMDIEKKRKKHEQELTLRNRIMEIMLTISDEKMYEKVLTEVQEAMASPFGVFGYIDDKQNFICPTLTQEVWEDCNVTDKDIVFPLEQWGGIWGRAMVEKKTLYSNRPFKVPEGHIPINSALTVPVIYREKLIGNLMVANKETDYNEKDSQLLETIIAGYIAPILNARLQRDREEKARIEFQAALQKSEQTLKTIFENARDGILLADAQTRQLVQANTAMSQMLGYGQEELTELYVDDIHPSEELHRVLAEFERQLRGEIALAPNIPVRHKDGSIFPADVNASPFELDGRRLILGLFRDITKQKSLEQQLQESQKLEAIGTLTGGIAHDFNNLLSIIIGYIDFLDEETGIDDPKSKYVDEIKKAGHRATTLVRQLLAFSRKQIIKPIVIDLNGILLDFEKMLRRIIGEDIGLEMITPSGLWLVKIDPSQVEQVIMNLAVNAKDAMPKGGQLTIETANNDLDAEYFHEHAVEIPPGPYVVLAVSDTGFGMDEHTRSRAFEPFFTTKAKGKGTGLGLSTVYGIVKQNHGHIWIYSEPGKGTTIKVYLPRSEEDILIDEAEKAMEEKLEGTETIMVVEDDNSLRKLSRKILKKFGYTVIEAKNGEEALPLFKEQEGSIQLVLTDVVMPEMGGADLVKHLKHQKSDLAVIYMSGYTDNAIAHHGILDKGINFIEKPLSSKTLVGMIRKVLDETKG